MTGPRKKKEQGVKITVSKEHNGSEWKVTALVEENEGDKPRAFDLGPADGMDFLHIVPFTDEEIADKAKEIVADIYAAEAAAAPTSDVPDPVTLAERHSL